MRSPTESVSSGVSLVETLFIERELMVQDPPGDHLQKHSEGGQIQTMAAQ